MNLVDSLSPFWKPASHFCCSPHLPHSANIFERSPSYHLEPPLDLKCPSPASSQCPPEDFQRSLSHRLPGSLSFPLQPPLGAAVFSLQFRTWKHEDVREMLWASQFVFLLSRLFFLSSLRFSVADSSLDNLCFISPCDPLVDSWRSLLHGLFSCSWFMPSLEHPNLLVPLISGLVNSALGTLLCVITSGFSFVVPPGTHYLSSLFNSFYPVLHLLHHPSYLC